MPWLICFAHPGALSARSISDVASRTHCAIEQLHSDKIALRRPLGFPAKDLHREVARQRSLRCASSLRRHRRTQRRLVRQASRDCRCLVRPSGGKMLCSFLDPSEGLDRQSTE